MRISVTHTLLVCLAVSALNGTRVNAQLAYQNTQMGEDYKVYIYKKSSLGNGKWRFKTKTVFKCGSAAMPGCKASQPYISEWRVADCLNSKIDGKAVPMIAKYGYEKGEPEIFKSVCRLQPKITLSRQSEIQAYIDGPSVLVLKKDGADVKGIRNWGGDGYCFQGKLSNGKLMIKKIDSDYVGPKEIYLSRLTKTKYSPSTHAATKTWKNQCLLHGR